ncbi:MAG: CBS domain-containing protein [Sphingobacteriales bacterium]|nr:MAG: CBS domain-containing protein [Sphingobacteriales bacterium]
MNTSFLDFVINSTSTLKMALIKMTASYKGLLFVVDDEYKLLGALADGDVRRALINDVTLSIPIEQIMNLNPITAKSEAEATQLLKSRPHLLVIPVVDSNGVLMGVYSGFNGEKYIVNDNIEQNNPEAVEHIHAPRKKVLAIIPARGGSKRIPQKNLSKIGDESLLARAIKVAKKSSYIDHVTVSTDNEEIAAEAKHHGIEVPWLRPHELATDTAKSVDVMIHAVEMFDKEQGYAPDLVVLLEPTAPLRTYEMIDDAISYFLNEKGDSLVAVNQIRHNFHPEEVLKDKDGLYVTPYLDNRNFETRKLRGGQDKAYVQNGLIYIVKTDVLLGLKSIYGSHVLKYETSADLFCDIDESEDLKIAALKLKAL